MDSILAMAVPHITYLGIISKYVEIKSGPEPFWQRHILGLRSSIPLYFFPQTLAGQKILLGVYHPYDDSEVQLILRPLDGGESINLRLDIGGMKPLEYSATGGIREQEAPVGWQWVVKKLPQVIVWKPNRFRVLQVKGSEEFPLGYLNFAHAPIPPFTPDEIAAKRSDPSAPKSGQLELGCDSCDNRIKCYTALERDQLLESAGWIWQRALPDSFVCSCGKVKIDLQYLRTGFHGILHKMDRDIDGNAALVPLYTQTVLKEYGRGFSALVESNPPEEELQKFLEAHPIFFSRFHPIKNLFVKAPILNKYKTDFVLLTEQKELILVEIERADLSLLKGDLGVSAELQHAVGQVHDWKRIFDDHRAATLEGMGLKLEDVGRISGVVIGGRRPKDEEHARRLAAEKWIGVEILTYDDLLASLREITKEVSKL